MVVETRDQLGHRGVTSVYLTQQFVEFFPLVSFFFPPFDFFLTQILSGTGD